MIKIKILNIKIVVGFVLILIIALVSVKFINTETIKINTPLPDLTDMNNPFEKYPDLANWKRPDGPLRVGLQVGHWKNDELPDELAKFRNNGGTSNGNTAEWEVNLKIAQETKNLLEQQGIVVDILPATVPVGYWADAFVAIHTDGSLNSRVAGFKAAVPHRDRSGKASKLLQLIEGNYGQVTGFSLDPNVTENMTGYYVFSWRRYDHSIHPMTPAIILETGFLTNPFEAKKLVNNPNLPARGIAQSIIQFLASSSPLVALMTKF
jgi:hypothetical protein